MSWGPIVHLEPKRTPEEQERFEDERKAGQQMRRVGWILALVFIVLGVRNCAAMGEQVERDAAYCATVSTRRGG